MTLKNTMIELLLGIHGIIISFLLVRCVRQGFQIAPVVMVVLLVFNLFVGYKILMAKSQLREQLIELEMKRREMNWNKRKKEN